MSTTAEPLVMPEMDERDKEEQRYAIYAVAVTRDGRSAGARVEISAMGELETLGVALAMHRAEGNITDDTRVGILDRVEGKWIVNPWAKGVL